MHGIVKDPGIWCFMVSSEPALVTSSFLRDLECRFRSLQESTRCLLERMFKSELGLHLPAPQARTRRFLTEAAKPAEADPPRRPPDAVLIDYDAAA
jgi:hypothetical protein